MFDKGVLIHYKFKICLKSKIIVVHLKSIKQEDHYIKGFVACLCPNLPKYIQYILKRKSFATLIKCKFLFIDTKNSFR